MIKTRYSYSRESGIASIFSVIFFMIFITILTVSFTKVVADEQRQSTDNDLSANALAAARSGVEDARRILVYCRKAEATEVQAACNTLLNGGATCSTMANGTVQSNILTPLSINMDANGQVDVANASNYQQKYLCLIINRNAKVLEDIPIPLESSYVVPLASNAQTLTMEWHNTDASREGAPGNRNTVSTQLPKVNEWKDPSGKAYPAMMRIQAIKVGSTLDGMDKDARTIFVMPTFGDAPDEYDINNVDLRNIANNEPRTLTPDNNPAARPRPIKCAAGSQYACKLNLKGFDAGQKYFLRITSLYASTHIKLSASNAAGAAEFFDIQPKVDVTGRLNDVYRRISANITYGDPTSRPITFGVQSGNGICKNITQEGSTRFVDHCEEASGAPTLVNEPSIGAPEDSGRWRSRRCYQVRGWNDPLCWNITLNNTGNYSQDRLDRCVWKWGDVEKVYPGSHPNCKKGASVTYSFPPHDRSEGVKRYKVTLTTYVKDDKGNIFEEVSAPKYAMRPY